MYAMWQMTNGQKLSDMIIIYQKQRLDDHVDKHSGANNQTISGVIILICSV